MSTEEEIPKALDKTGFPFENFVVSALRAQEWYIISNRYYLDDVERKPRELDILAYKTAKVDGVPLRLALLISCKKDEKRSWAFLSRRKPKIDPNTNWEPTHYVANAEPLKSYWSRNEWGADFIKTLDQSKRYLFSPDRDIFANQLVTKDGKTAQNNNSIFSSVTGLMKALHHEKGRLSGSKRRKRVYFFLPITLVDSNLFDVNYDLEEAVATEVSKTSTLMSYMVDGEDMSTVVTFSSKENITNLLSDLDIVFDKIKKNIKKENRLAYESIKNNPNTQSYFLEQLNEKLRTELRVTARKWNIKEKLEFSDIWYFEEVLQIDVAVTDSDIGGALEDEALVDAVRKFLEEEARYTEGFTLNEGMPF